jgi:predicted nucleic acid-binding protein
VAEATDGVLYADTSALVKLIVHEAESEAVESELARWSLIASSEVVTVELSRAAARARADDRATVADGRSVLEILAALRLVPTTDEIRAAAAALQPPELRTLDAIHLASALALGEDLAAVPTYDHRMADAARKFSLDVVAPT